MVLYKIPISDTPELPYQDDFCHHELCREKTLGFPAWSDTNRAVQPQKMVRDLQFLI